MKLLERVREGLRERLGRRHEEHGFKPATLEILDRPPSPAGRAVGIAIMGFAVLAVTWATLAEMEVVVAAQGKIIPLGRVKVVQAAEPGVVRAIHVEDGQRVSAGEVLIELDPTATQADRVQLSRERMETAVTLARLRAQLTGDARHFVPPAEAELELVAVQRALLESHLLEQAERLEELDGESTRGGADRDAIRSTMEKLRSTLPLVRERLERKLSLSSSGYVPELEIIEARLEVMNHEKELEVQRHRLAEAEAGLRLTEGRRRQARAEFRSRTLTELSEAGKRFEALEQELVKAERHHALQRLRAPVDGMVQQLAANTTVGAVVTVAQQLLVVVPEEMGLEVEAKVLNKDIGSIESGQSAAVKLEAFEFTRHGSLAGTIQWVGEDTVDDERLGPVYPVRIKLADNHLPNAVNGRHGVAAAGMAVTADIEIGKRRMIDYFLAPLLRYKAESLRER